MVDRETCGCLTTLTIILLFIGACTVVYTGDARLAKPLYEYTDGERDVSLGMIVPANGGSDLFLPSGKWYKFVGDDYYTPCHHNKVQVNAKDFYNLIGPNNSNIEIICNYVDSLEGIIEIKNRGNINLNKLIEYNGNIRLTAYFDDGKTAIVMFNDKIGGTTDHLRNIPELLKKMDRCIEHNRNFNEQYNTPLPID